VAPKHPVVAETAEPAFVRRTVADRLRSGRGEGMLETFDSLFRTLSRCKR